MRKLLSILSILALAFATGCQREQVDTNTDESGDKDVAVRFVFNVSNSSNKTKQSAADIQSNESEASFRGIVDAKLLTYTLDDGQGNLVDGQILAEDKTADRGYELTSLAAENTVNSETSHRVMEMSLPLRTNTVLLYARAKKPSSTDDADYSVDECYGKLDKYAVTHELGSADFKLGQRLSSESLESFYAAERVLSGILTIIMNSGLDGTVGFSATDVPDDGVAAYGFTASAAECEVKWSDYAASSKSPINSNLDQYPQESKLSYLYSQMTTIRSVDNELRAGAGSDVIATVKDLWSVLNGIRCSTPISKEDAIAKFMSVKICDNIQKFFKATSIPTDGTAVGTVTFQTLANMSAVFNTAGNWPTTMDPTKKASGDDIDILVLGNMSLAQFPDNFYMPRGVSYMAFDSETEAGDTYKDYFYYPKNFNTSDVGGAPSIGGSYDALSYYYPAEILYFGNSPVRASSTEHKPNTYPEGTANWGNDNNWTGWDQTHVVSSSKSVAMKYDINYGVAVLKTMVGYSENVLSKGYLLDNNHAVQKVLDDTISDNEEPDKHVPVTATSFKLTGVIIGGQPVQVGWDFLPITDKTGFIYDRAIHKGTNNNSQSIPAALDAQTGKAKVSNPNYTVVFDNYKTGDQSDQSKVYVALEFLNNSGEDFYGNCNLIKAGGYFYLIGELDPAAQTGVSGITWPTKGHVIPPYYTTGANKGKSREVTRVFVQDFETAVTFRFGANSLKSAYLTMPDLKASSLTFGLSVDINWQHGLEYEKVIIGGGDDTYPGDN